MKQTIDKLRRQIARRPYILAVLIAVALAAWLLSGDLGRPGAEGRESAARDGTEEARELAVRVREMTASSVTREVRVHGDTAPSRTTVLAAEISGRIVATPVKRGARVEKGEVIARIEVGERRERLEQAEALVEQRELEHKGAQSLAASGYNAKVERAQAATALKQARAELREARLALERTEIRAPYAAVLRERDVEVGDFVQAGTEVARLIDVNPFVVSGDVAETEVGELSVGQPGVARLVTGRELEGHIRYIDPVAEQSTRTYTVELEVPNPERRLVAGMSAEMRIALDTVPAHKVSPAVLSLDDDGALGVKVVDAGGRVQFRPVEIIRAETDGVWLGGLGERIRLITVGQGFARPGERVRIVLEDTASPESAS